MFDKLIESNSEEAEFKNRRGYFMVSSVVVGVLFLAAVVASIYAGEIGIGNGDLELSELMPPVEMAAVEPDPPKPQAAQTLQTSELPSRQVNILRLDEQPIVPTTTSVIPNTQAARPTTDFTVGKLDSNPTSSQGPGRDPVGPGNTDTGLSATQSVVEEVTKPQPPPAFRPVEPKRPISIGVVNGKAINLPKPPYPPAAIAINAQGNVDVQVTIDETGKVISSKAVTGHPLLRGAAEKAAWGARFSPTLLSNVPVKVTGVIVYKFSR